MPRTHLLIIDPQNDFCDPERGALAVPGADADMVRLAAFIDAEGEAIHEIHVTLDSHHPVDIAHPVFWRDASGAPPAPFTVIPPAAVRDGLWSTARPEDADRALAYLDALEAAGRYPHVIWPPHCLIGTWGHGIAPPLTAALRRWTETTWRPVRYISKGENPWTEHFSAIRAEVPEAGDPHTQPNTNWLTALIDADRVLVAGEAGSHCVANTVRDLVATIDDPNLPPRLTLLTDAVSPVPGFEAQQTQFLADLTKKGMKLARTTDLSAP